MSKWEEAKWQEVRDGFKGTLLIGNGASQAIYNEFSYSNIHKRASELGNITPDVCKVFDSFNTKDFELVLRHLLHASIVNGCLGIQNNKVEDSYKDIRDALIKTINTIHISYEDAAKHFKTIGLFIRQFKNIVSLNYDLLLYWVIMNENSKDHKNPYFKDGFGNGGVLREDITELYEPINDQKSACLVAYPHGNLCIGLFAQSSTEEKIIADRSASLLKVITHSWEEKKAIPVFVSEADSNKKMISIQQSNYLTRIFYEVLPNLSHPVEHDGSLTIYGWRLGEQDKHILKQLSKNSFKRVAVSYYGERNEEHLNTIWKKLSTHIKEIVFYPASSEGAWNNLDQHL